MVFRRLISASQGARVTVGTTSSADTAMLPQAVNSSYPSTLESQRSYLLLCRCCVRRSAVGQGLPQINSASGLYSKSAT